ncbi:unnamed protein product [Toxocara canis]|uniref:Elongation of very long chain fatty acids protein n=1 Tax=Toxocara canis TaxID=6265 RepID=A0A183U1A4_TOXCA|nr:unnamed protein product [Toxocara canis]
MKPPDNKIIPYLQQTWWYSLILSILYLVSVATIVSIMRKRAAFGLRRALLCWNVALAAFSLFGFIRTSDEFFSVLLKYGYYQSVCYSYKPDGVTSYWSLMFLISKAVELGDTFFIVLRKRPLIFLHYYHHIAVLIYTAHSGAEHTGSGRWFIWMNYLVHSVMYSYYAIVASGRRPPKRFAITVTSFQITQMIVGLIVCASVIFYKSRRECQQSSPNVALCLLIYASFAILFVRFFRKAYIRSDTKKSL